MIQHWLTSKENAYLGSSYGGRDIAFAAPEGHLNDESCKEFMTKLKDDIPMLIKIPLTDIIKSAPTITFYFGDAHKTYKI